MGTSDLEECKNVCNPNLACKGIDLDPDFDGCKLFTNANYMARGNGLHATKSCYVKSS